MNNFLKSVVSNSDNKKVIIKQSIITQLSECVKEIQLCDVEEQISGAESVDIGEACNNLCSIVEAIFLHGHKDSLVHKARRVIGNDIDQKPEPNFLSPLLIFSHRQIIEQITSLSNISTEIGQCRAWIRIALNDSLLSSYLSLMIKDNKTLSSYYKNFAFLRDIELLDVACKLIESVEEHNNFGLPYNSSILNHWPLPTLLLAGIWSPTLRRSPITSGIDVAQSLANTPTKPKPDSQVGQSSTSELPCSSELGKLLALNEDEALKIIFSNTEQQNYLPPAENVDTIKDETSKEKKENVIVSNTKNADESSENLKSTEEPANLGNSLNRQSGWSFDESHSELVEQQTQKKPNANHTSTADGTKLNDHSYHALVKSYSADTAPDVKIPNLQDVWQSFSDANVNDFDNGQNGNLWPINNIADQMGFKIIFSSMLDKEDIRSFLSQIGQLAQEKGLDSQNYECYGCKHPLGINLCKPRICAFSGDCYCDSCMSTEAIMIPARILHNWDFKQYFVSKKIILFVNDIKSHPLLDLKILNPYIYKGVEEMAKLESLRIQLNYLRDYLFTCREPVIEQFKSLIWPKEYMYEHIHQYSVADLRQITGGYLADQLQKVIQFGRNHVVGCWLCSQKGFVCEICRNPKILYPFDVESTYRCKFCSGVYHTTCLDFTKPCPKCKRRNEHTKRQEISFLEATLE